MPKELLQALLLKIRGEGGLNMNFIGNQEVNPRFEVNLRVINHYFFTSSLIGGRTICFWIIICIVNIGRMY